ncbi:16S rRNA (guanine(527)-N(7))-methyltransferase RsmG [Petroclostridium sp. X23]|uniref:16S rRNA (guanine(527)-N(7))-methyltransferase RsmG n=1 Tax=Petroclostridium sp. X23 TaxID=3045146 RepID=UPI0024AD3B4B|nr:16S rRNA (guanine(527)-N(7))-methyltransferase RsmG [Petroclostridium sp. X23]WHH57255.1 16S rRNA (guanine(527)-N(7))-methyltransferase RsmG [Petroclostridium sp. X23]
MESVDLLREGARQFNIDLTDEKIEKFVIYKNMLLEWNKKMNLTAIEDEKEIIIKHFLDSISCIFTNVFETGSKIIDVGTGAGFPAIPLKIVNCNLNITLLDSLNKRLNFLDEVIKELKFDNIVTMHGRAEDIGNNKQYREEFDVSISRAVANLSVLAEYCLPLSKVGGYFISMKGPDVTEEMNESKNAIHVLGGEIVDIKKILLPHTQIQHSIIVIKKVRQCPTKYPRKAGKPSKDPIK